MTVYGEEHFNVDISKGLFISPSPDSIPDGYCARLSNMVRTPRNTWEARKGLTSKGIKLTAGSNMGYTLNNVTAILVPEQEIEDPELAFGEFSGSATSTAQMWIRTFSTTFSIQTITHYSGLSGFSNDYQSQNVSTLTDGLTDLIEYKDKHYGSTDNGVYEISGFNYAAATNLTATAIQSLTNPSTNPVGHSSLVAYYNRLFWAYGNRVYYTEVAVSGGYPTNWNSGNNFFELPSSTVGTTNVIRMFNLNGYLYFFTDKGVYLLNGQGSSTSWQIRFITDTPKIYSRQGVCVVNGTFICTDRKNLYIFNGSSATKIGTEISAVFDVYNSYSVSPYEKGFILSCKYFANIGGKWTLTTPTGALGNYLWGKFKALYFDGATWSQIDYQNSASSDGFEVITSFANKAVQFSPKQNNSFILFRDDITNSFYMTYLDFSQDTDTHYTLTGRDDINPYLRTRDISLGQISNVPRIKKIYVGIYNLFTSLIWSLYSQGNIAPIKNGTVTISTQTNDYNTLETLPGPSYFNRFSVQVGGSTSNTRNTTGGINYPVYGTSFEIKDIVLVGDSDKRDTTPQVSS